MPEYIERTEELVLAMNAGARAIENTKRYHGAIYNMDVFSQNSKGIPFLLAAKVLREVSDAPTADVAPVRHGQWKYNTDFQVWNCSECGENPHKGTGVVVVEENLPPYCPHCGVRMDGRRLEGKENETEELG